MVPHFKMTQDSEEIGYTVLSKHNTAVYTMMVPRPKWGVTFLL